MWKGLTDSKKAKRLSKEEIKKKLLDSMTIDEIVEFDDLDKEAEETQDPEEAAKIIKRYEDIIKTKNKGIMNVAYHQGQVFKRFKEKEKFAKLVSELGFHKTTIIFKINVLKLCKKWPLTVPSSMLFLLPILQSLPFPLAASTLFKIWIYHYVYCLLVSLNFLIS